MATVTTSITNAITSHGIIAVFVLMAMDAVLPIGGELIMLYAGVLAAGAAGGAHLALFGSHVPTGGASYALVVAAGALGTLAGALIAYTAGARVARTGTDRRPRWLPVTDEGFERAQVWFAAHERTAVFLGRITPVVRSLISIPAGILRIPVGAYTVWTLAGALVWCLAFAAIGWALAGAWQGFHHSFQYADYVFAAAAVALVAAAVVRHVIRPGRLRTRLEARSRRGL